MLNKNPYWVNCRQVLPISQNPNAWEKRTKVNANEEWSRRRTSSITTEFTFVMILGFS